MRGRTIYFQNRRILVFCGKKRKQPHSDNDVFGYAADEIVVSESVSATARNGENLFAENENGAAFGDAAKTVTTEAVQTPVVSPEEGEGGALGLPSEDDGIVTTPVYDSANAGFLIAHNVDKNGVITTDQPLIERDKPHLSFGEANEEIKTRLSRFDEAEEQGLSFREENNHIKTTIPWFVKNADDAGFSLREEAEEIITPVAVFTEAEDDSLIVDNADEIKTPVAVFDKTNSTAAVGEDTKPLKTETAVLSEEKNATRILTNSKKTIIPVSVFSSVKNAAAFGNYAKAGVEEPVAIGDFISFSSTEPFSVKTNNSTKTWNGTLEYSIDAETWVIWDGTSAIGNDTRLYIRGRNNNKITNGVKWVATATAGIKVQGVLETLLDYVSVANGNIPSAKGYCFDRLFSGWDKLTDAGDLIILTLNVQYYCRLLFSSCSSLTKAPVILGTDVAQSACEGMFKNDISLELPPQITITSIAVGGFMQAFLGCTSLLYPIKMAGVSTMPANACFEMYRGCTSLSKIPAFTATSYADALLSMFYECPQIKMSETQTDEYQHAYRMPMSGNGTASVSNPFAGMFAYTGGTFTGTPTINTIYYTSNEIIS